MTVIICDKCDGTGEYLSFENDNKPEMVECNRCNGTGRVYIKTYTLKMPFGTDNILLNKIDGEIMEILINKDNIS